MPPPDALHNYKHTLLTSRHNFKPPDLHDSSIKTNPSLHVEITNPIYSTHSKKISLQISVSRATSILSGTKILVQVAHILSFRIDH